LIQALDGNFYGTTSRGGEFDRGTVFRITPGGDEAVLYSFAGGSADGIDPSGALVQGSDGNFYGTTTSGGISACAPDFSTGALASCGIVFKVTPGGKETVLHFFGGTGDGGAPNGALLQAPDGNFYGTTSDASGTVFKLTPAGVETVLFSFPNSALDGSKPSSLILGPNGSFYGTTFAGGQSNYGTVFTITPAGAETVLYSFAAGGDGENPSAPLVKGSDGNFYGTTAFGGTSHQGTAFRTTPGGQETVLYSFPGGTGNGANPYTALIQGLDGSLYGGAAGGNQNSDFCGGGCGSLYAITLIGHETVLYLFSASTLDGALPSGLIQGSDGNFYGTTSEGGRFDGGEVFQITPAGVLTVLHSFPDIQ
jgi:uncharacterized repeat protein (TIGR03803 family)